jgi:hypothetical protein
MIGFVTAQRSERAEDLRVGTLGLDRTFTILMELHMSRIVRMFVAVGALGLVGTVAASAQGTATQVVAFEVQRINVISTAGAPSLTITTAVAGSQPTQVSDHGSYSITSNDEGAGAGAKITAEINANIPARVTLKATQTAPAVGSSAGAVTLSTTPVDAVTGVIKVIGSGLDITYTLDALVSAGVVSSGTRTVTLTVVAAI